MNDYVYRITRFAQLDLDTTYWQMTQLLLDPSSVYRAVIYHKATKNFYARDDPTFNLVLAVFMIIGSLAWSLAFHISNPLRWIYVMVWSIGVDFFLLGILISSLTYWISNRYLRSISYHQLEQRVEWLYCFDVHCNAFFPLFCWLYVIQFFLLPILTASGFLSASFSNAMFALALSYYFHLTFLGFKTLPFLVHTRIFLYPIVPIILLSLLFALLSWNPTIFLCNIYFA